MIHRFAYLSLCAALLAAAGAVPAAAQSTALMRCDKPMAEVDSLVARMGECVRSGKAATDQSVPQPAAPVAPLIPPALRKEAASEPASSRLVAYFAAAAYESGNTSFCQAPLMIDEARGILCLEAGRRNPAALAMFSSPAAFAAGCVEVLRNKEMGLGGAVDPEIDRQLGQCCAALAASSRRPDACPSLTPVCYPNVAACEAGLTFYSGDKTACGNLQPDRGVGCMDAADCGKAREACALSAAYGKALKSKDIAACGTGPDSYVCRIKMGGARGVTEELTPLLNATPAGRWYVSGMWKRALAPKPEPAAPAFAMPVAAIFKCEYPLRSEGNRAAVAKTIDAARSCLTDIELALSRIDIATAQGLDAREEKLIRSGLKFAEYMGDVPARPAARAPAPAKTH